MQKNVFLLSVYLPKITFDANYDVNAQIIVPIKGRGPMNGTACKYQVPIARYKHCVAIKSNGF